MSFDKTFDLVNLLNRVDFPEFVYPTRAITGTLFFSSISLNISIRNNFS